MPNVPFEKVQLHEMGLMLRDSLINILGKQWSKILGSVHPGNSHVVAQNVLTMT